MGSRRIQAHRHHRLDVPALIGEKWYQVTRPGALVAYRSWLCVC